MQLERILQSQGFGSRKACRILIRRGEVEIGGTVYDDPFAELEPEGLRFSVHGEPWQYRTHAYLMLHKPAHYECSHKPLHHPTIYSLLPHPLVERGVQCIGRLDEDTTGLILMSDDGQFIHRMSSPRWKVPKVYEVTTKHPVDSAQIHALLDGVVLADENTPTAALACEQIDARRIHLTLAEGKYHQVKRMLAAAGNRVDALKRIRIGALELPNDLAPGTWRWLSDDELRQLNPQSRQTQSIVETTA
ncbi:MAG TPA: 16S rRNA pseudouridine(516) synthase [Methylophilaceae bacterium]|jgi:16S rRNA pseudouridine516 synthase